MSNRDDYYNRAKQEGYRARSAYKLQQLDETSDLLDAGATVLDLGAAPGGWLQVAAERVGSEGTVVGVDRQSIDPLADADPTMEYVRGDMTEAATVADVVERVGGDAGAVEAASGDAGDRGGPVDVVVSDLAPDMTGEYELDHARSVHLARQAFEVATEVLAAGGDFVVKVFDGRDLADLEADIEGEFEYVRQVRPEASRDSSAELYLVAKGRLTTPVREGDRRTVDIIETGREGDGVASLDGYTLFVSGAEEGETVDVVLEDVKPTFGFAEPVD